jgi:hypothetical protein
VESFLFLSDLLTAHEPALGMAALRRRLGCATKAARQRSPTFGFMGKRICLGWKATWNEMRLISLWRLSWKLSVLCLLHSGLSAEAADQRPGDKALPRTKPVPSVFGANLAAGGGTNRSSFHVSSVPRTIHGGIHIPTFVIAADTSRFSFLPPSGWNAHSTASEKTIKLVRPESGALITVRIIEDKSDPAVELTNETLRPILLSRYPSAKIVEELSASALGQSAPAFELESRTSNNARQRTRVAFVPFPGGYLECALTAATEKIGPEYHGFNQFLLSFRHAPLKGKLELQPVTPE